MDDPLNLNPNPQENLSKSQFILGSKGLLIAVIFVAIALIIGFKTLVSSSSVENYKGLIQKVDEETEKLNTSASGNEASQEAKTPALEAPSEDENKGLAR